MTFEESLDRAAEAIYAAFAVAAREMLPENPDWLILRGYDPVAWQRRKWRERMRRLNRAGLLVQGCRPRRKKPGLTGTG